MRPAYPLVPRWDAAAPQAAPPVPVPPGRMAPARGGRPLKRWRYVAAFSDEVMLCAAVAAVGPARSSWWAVWDRRAGELHERTRIAPGPPLVRFGHGGRVQVRDRGGVAIDLAVDEGAGIESLNAHGAQYVWTRKQAARPVAGAVRLPGGRTIALAGALAVVDDTAGYHARETEWWWSAGIGRADDGSPVGWNLVAGVNDGAHGSERSVWVAGRAQEVGPVRFAGDLSAVSLDSGESLRFTAEAVRARHDRLVLVESEYRQPFGTFFGALPGAGTLRDGLGVMEHHRARW